MMDTRRIKMVVIFLGASFLKNTLLADEKKTQVTNIDKLLENSELNRRKKLEDLELLLKKTFLEKDIVVDGFNLAKSLCETPAWIHDIDNKRLIETFGNNRVFQIEENYLAVAIGDINQQKKELHAKLPISKLGKQWFLMVKLDKNNQKALNTCYLSYSTVMLMRLKRSTN